MPRVVVEVMPKPEIFDPQGKTITDALQHLGFSNYDMVRQGKRFELHVASQTSHDELLTQARQAAETLFANPVIEDVVNVTVLDD